MDDGSMEWSNNNNNNNNSQLTVGMKDNSTDRGRKKGDLTDTERSILLFFVQRKKDTVTLNELRGYAAMEGITSDGFYMSLATLIQKKVLLDYFRGDIPCISVRDQPVIIMNLLDLSRYATAVVLISLVEYHRPFIIQGKEDIPINLRDFIYLVNNPNIFIMYKTSNRTFRKAVHELCERDYLEHTDSKNIYLLRWRKIPGTVLEYLLGSEVLNCSLDRP